MIIFRPQPLHIPDGMLSPLISGIFWAISSIVLYIAIRRTRGDLGERQIPLMGVMAAFIFAAQMLNFPVAGGATGHLLGGALAAAALGPWAGMLVMTSVVLIQGLLFQDGGLVVMGANIFNMGLITVVVGYGIYRIAAGRSRSVRLAAVGIGAWLSVMAAAFFTSLQLWLSMSARLDLVVPAMLGIHSLIGLGEALITVAALSFILRMRPDILEPHAKIVKTSRGWITAGLLVVLILVILSPLAAVNPDGLEKVAEDLGFLELAAAPSFEIMPDYTLPFLGETSISTIVSAAVGAIIAAGVVLLLVRLLLKRKQVESAVSRK
jgi:cobalt/nickel transport system permease protein